MEETDGIQQKTGVPNVWQVDKAEKEEKLTLSVSVELLRNHVENGIIGGYTSLLALKSPSSYLIGSDYTGIKLIEDGVEIYSARLPFEHASLNDLVYIEHLNFYLLHYNKKIYRKDIDDQAPYIFMDFECNRRSAVCFRYSAINKALLVKPRPKIISIVDLENKKAIFHLRLNRVARIMDFRIFGEEQQRVILVGDRGDFLQYYLNFSLRKVCCFNHIKIDVIDEGRWEQVSSIAVCPKNEYVLVEIQSWNTNSCSRMMILKLTKTEIVMKAVLDLFEQNLGYKYALRSLGYFGGRAFWLGLTFGENGVVQIFQYDPEKDQFEEEEDLRVSHQEKNPVMIEFFKKHSYFYIGMKGQLMRLKVTL